MDKNVKLVRNNGWAFSEEKDLRHLEELAKEGWILKALARGGYYYKLEQEAPLQLQYSLDCYTGKKEDYFAYLELFEEAGWQPVCSLGDGRSGTYTIFKGDEELTPIYSDKSSLQENYKEQKLASLKGLATSFLIYLLFGLLNLLSVPPLLSVIFVGISFLSFIYGTICSMLSVVYSLREKHGHEVKFPDKVVWPVLIIASVVVGGLVGAISVFTGFWIFS